MPTLQDLKAKFPARNNRESEAGFAHMHERCLATAESELSLLVPNVEIIRQGDYEAERVVAILDQRVIAVGDARAVANFDDPFTNWFDTPSGERVRKRLEINLQRMLGELLAPFIDRVPPRGHPGRLSPEPLPIRHLIQSCFVPDSA